MPRSSEIERVLGEVRLIDLSLNFLIPLPIPLLRPPILILRRAMDLDEATH